VGSASRKHSRPQQGVRGVGVGRGGRGREGRGQSTKSKCAATHHLLERIFVGVAAVNVHRGRIAGCSWKRGIRWEDERERGDGGEGARRCDMSGSIVFVQFESCCHSLRYNCPPHSTEEWTTLLRMVPQTTVIAPSDELDRDGNGHMRWTARVDRGGGGGGGGGGGARAITFDQLSQFGPSHTTHTTNCVWVGRHRRLPRNTPFAEKGNEKNTSSDAIGGLATSGLRRSRESSHSSSRGHFGTKNNHTTKKSQVHHPSTTLLIASLVLCAGVDSFERRIAWLIKP